VKQRFNCRTLIQQHPRGSLIHDEFEKRFELTDSLTFGTSLLERNYSYSIESMGR